MNWGLLLATVGQSARYIIPSYLILYIICIFFLLFSSVKYITYFFFPFYFFLFVEQREYADSYYRDFFYYTRSKNPEVNILLPRTFYISFSSFPSPPWFFFLFIIPFPLFLLFFFSSLLLSFVSSFKSQN